MSSFRLAAYAGVLALTLNGCVPRDAGYQDVQKLVRERAGADVRWNYLDGTSKSAETTQRLLSRPLTAEAAVQIALLNNRGLQAAFEDLGVARADLVAALALPNPRAEASLGFHTGGGGAPDIDLGATLSITQLFLLPLRNSAGRAELDAAKLSVGAAALDVAFWTRTAFYRYLADKQILELRRTVLLAARASAEAAKGLYDAGNVTTLDLANEQALYEEARIAVAQSEVALAGSRERLNGLMGLWGRGGTWHVTGRLPHPPDSAREIEDLESRAVGRSVDLALTRGRFAAAAARINAGYPAAWIPELRGGAIAEREDGDWEVGPLVELEIPIFYQGNGMIARGQAEMRRQRNLHTEVAIILRAQARALAPRFLSAQNQAAFYKNTLLPLREKIVNETQLQFNAMTVGVFQLLQAKRDQVETGRAYVEALRNYWVTRAAVDQLLAGRLVRSAPETVNPIETSESDGAAVEPSEQH